MTSITSIMLSDNHLIASEESIIHSPAHDYSHPALETVEKVFWVVSGILDPVTGFFTQGLADFLCLDTLRHGTSWRNYVYIRIHGADPKLASNNNKKGACQGLHIQAGKSEEEIRKAQIYFENSKGFFFVQRDSTVGTNDKGDFVDIFKKSDYKGVKNVGMGVISNRPPSLYQECIYQLFIRNVPRFYAWLSGVAEGAPSTATGKLAKAKQIGSGCLNILTPTVNFRFLPEDVSKSFKDDPLLIGSAICTDQPIGTEHLGLTGIFIQGSQGNIGERIRKNPGKALWGIVRLINPIGITLLLSFGIFFVTLQSLESRKVKVNKAELY